MPPFPTRASAFFDAMAAAAEAERRGARLHCNRAQRPRRSGRWTALALVPVLLLAAIWML